MIDKFQLGHEWLVLFFSMLPFFELRLSIPYGILNHVPWQTTFILSIIGNFLPIIPLLFLLEKILALFIKIDIFNRMYNFIMRNTQKKSALVKKYGLIGLYIFVSIPIPGSGIYTGSVLALLFDMKKRDAFIALSAGMVTAGVLVTLATLGIVSVFDNPLAIFIVILVIVFAYRRIQARRINKQAQ